MTEVAAVGAGRSLQLDVFRATAAVFMIVNHSGSQLLSIQGAAGWPSWLVFVGSAAPALFFFATGVGSGFSAGRGEAIGSMLRKTVLLLLADMLLNWGSGSLLRFDFFGFAAVMTVVLYLVRKTRCPVRVASMLLALVLVARFGLVPFLRGKIPVDSVAAFITGIEPVHGISYPLGPWLAFPLMGFLIGRRWRQGVTMEEAVVVSSAGTLGFAASAILAEHGAPVFRWGSVSTAYFLCALGIIATAWLASSGLARWLPSLSRAVALRGAASLLIVPLHYAILGLLEELDPALWSPAAWLLATGLLVCAVLPLARGAIAGAGRLPAPGLPWQTIIAGVACAASLAAFLLAPALVRLEVASAGEVVMGILLLWSGMKPDIKPEMDPRASSARLSVTESQ